MIDSLALQRRRPSIVGSNMITGSNQVIDSTINHELDSDHRLHSSDDSGHRSLWTMIPKLHRELRLPGQLHGVAGREVLLAPCFSSQGHGSSSNFPRLPSPLHLTSSSHHPSSPRVNPHHGIASSGLVRRILPHTDRPIIHPIVITKDWHFFRNLTPLSLIQLILNTKDVRFS